ncbi:Nif3-like dinuclear metal center hexameric protein [Lacticaseibacillus sp. 53-4]|uniref:Nif3-like dinuclear metal center hexameric protein n=1 Tax=Lacticaseibacillus sp. 53-4 TaxID=2799575 RepID=UPI0019445C8F|nr:Nif3-like dinuclear metal center hexameric protein [Lacticaseibacillus sp. 53-4]
MKIQSIINAIESATDPNHRIPSTTIDQLIIGDSDQDAHGIVTSFMATVDVINAAIRLGANFIITHEPTWFDGHDRESLMQDDSVYQAKRELIAKHNLVIYRFHDHMHFGGAHDMIVAGVAKELGWSDYLLPGDPAGKNVLERAETRFMLPKTTLAEVLNTVRTRLKLGGVRYIGDVSQPVENVAALIGGATLGLGDEYNPIKQIRDQRIDLVISGDIEEWTVPAYIRDANRLGHPCAMLVIGHERSEESGMKWLPEWLADKFNLKAQWLDAGDPFERVLFETTNNSKSLRSN